MKGYLSPFQRIVRLYRDSNLGRDEMKDDSPFRHTLAGFEPTLAIGQRLRDLRRNLLRDKKGFKNTLI